MKTVRLLLPLLALPPLLAELPIRQVVLYKHGVGYFERAGTLAPTEILRLTFKPSEMDDVLKSLCIRDLTGGGVSAVRYDSSEPLEKKLADFPFTVEPAAPLSSLLDTLRGSAVQLDFGGQKLEGRIVSARRVPASGEQPEKELLVLALDSGELRNIDLGSVTSLQFREPALREKLASYLSRIDAWRSNQLRNLYIEARGTGPRNLILSYIIPTPVWKSSYRLVLGEKENTLEGWAIVDNTTAEDWRDVRLSVVSGRPVSFISPLYEPRYLTRPQARLPEEEAVPPALHEGPLAAAVAEPLRAEDKDRARLALRAPALETAAPRPSAEAGAPPAGLSSLSLLALAATAGELFEYNFPSPVTIRQGESAMLPFLQQNVRARRLLIYSNPGSQHPLHAVELVNNTGKTLDGGPVTVYDGNVYAGEALMETLKDSDSRILSYAVDLGTRITTAFGSRSDIVREIHFRRGVLVSRQAVQETRTYTIRNAEQKAKTLVIEHPARPQFELVSPKPASKTASAYRFEVKIAPGATTELPVTEERVFETTYAATSLTPDLLTAFMQNKALSDATRKQLEALLALKRRIAALDSELKQLGTEIEELNRDQERLRQNINSLSRLAGQQEQVSQYARQLALQENRLLQLRERQADLRRKRAEVEAELNQLIERMEF